MGVGFTMYYIVDSIEEVCLPITPLFLSSQIETDFGSNTSQTKEKAESLGGKALSATKEPEGTSGFYMYITDVEGNRFGIYELKK
jgi:hypothetical protein